MNKIHIMDEVLANKIAAGEVVEKTMNVVKELVENSIDARSNEIKIELIDSGVKRIKVSDNGVGMSRDDAMLAFSRHATSKLSTLDDLFNIESLGFRGEALPSIAAVSKLTLKTCDGNEGTTVFVNGGKIEKVEGSDLKKGTSITVEDLFYNTPVRLKYLKNLYIELANITDYVNKMALSYPNIRFTLMNNEKVLLHTDGSNNLFKVIYAIYGSHVAKKMIEVHGENDDYAITGYISYPEIAKTSRNHIITFVNGRLIRNNELNRTIIECYHTYIPKDKFPIIIFKIEVDPILIDINIHPTKMDIKFSKMNDLKELVEQIIKPKLKALTLIPNITNLELSEVTSEKVNTYKSDIESDYPDYSVSENLTLDFDYSLKEDVLAVDSEDTDTEEEPYKIKYMKPVGIVHATYIIAENEDGMFIIDQHAAQERINYEKYLKAMSKEDHKMVDLLVPISIELSNKDFIIFNENIELFKSIGFEVETFGINSLVIRAHPYFLPKGYEEQAIRKIIDIICEKEAFSKEKFVEKTAITLSCKMAIKANDVISLEEAEVLLNTLRKTENPFTCPHGRPTIITYTKYDLEKLFKRAMN